MYIHRANFSDDSNIQSSKKVSYIKLDHSRPYERNGILCIKAKYTYFFHHRNDGYYFHYQKPVYLNILMSPNAITLKESQQVKENLAKRRVRIPTRLLFTYSLSRPAAPQPRASNSSSGGRGGGRPPNVLIPDR